ncbi:MAG: haloacid dehalogenase-like hydrolase, partial [Muribaculaceae bacterium]
MKSNSDVDLMNEILINEDFSLFTAGSEETPDTECLCLLDGSVDSPKIDSKYTQQSGWTGGRVYQAGGVAALIPLADGLSAVLNTPYCDYSGNLTVTFRMKSIDPSGRTFFFLNCLRNGIDIPKDCIDKDGKYVYYKYNLKNEEGWKEFTVEFNNCSADADDFLQFNCYGQVLLDDFKVVAHNDFIAAPRLRDAKDFTYDGFTATWDKMRVAESYDVKAYYKKTQRPDDIVISASPEFLLKPEAQYLDFGKLIASKVDKHTGKYTGENCWGEEKVKRLV